MSSINEIVSEWAESVSKKASVSLSKDTLAAVEAKLAKGEVVSLSLEDALELYPDNEGLKRLEKSGCNTPLSINEKSKLVRLLRKEADSFVDDAIKVIDETIKKIENMDANRVLDCKVVKRFVCRTGSDKFLYHLEKEINVPKIVYKTIEVEKVVYKDV